MAATPIAIGYNGFPDKYMLSPGRIFLELYTGSVFVSFIPTNTPFSFPSLFISLTMSTAMSNFKSCSKSSFLITISV